jgi:hypothetical protein
MCLATLHYPDLNPVGVPSLAALLVVTALLALSRSEIGAGVERLAPALLLVLAALTDGSIPNSIIAGRVFPDADDDIAWIIYQSFGFGFAISNFRLPGRGTLFNGAVFAILHGGCLVLVGVGMLLESLTWALLIADVYVVLATIVAVRRAFDMRRRRQQDRGLRAQCAYDLRGSRASAVCPECGTATPWAAGGVSAARGLSARPCRRSAGGDRGPARARAGAPGATV